MERAEIRALEWLVDAAAAGSLGAAVLFALNRVGAEPALAASAAALGTVVAAVALRRVGPRTEQSLHFAPAPLPRWAEEREPLLLDDPLRFDPSSRAAHLFAAPTPAELLDRIDRHQRGEANDDANARAADALLSGLRRALG